TMEEGQISAWHKKEGDDVQVDDLLAEVETDKATLEFRSFDKGTLLKILAPAGTVVKLGQPVAVIGAKGEDIGHDAGPPPPPAAPPVPPPPPAPPPPAPRPRARPPPRLPLPLLPELRPVASGLRPTCASSPASAG